MRRSSLITIIIALALIALIAIYFAANQSGTTVTPEPSPSVTPSPSTLAASPAASSSPAATSTTINYSSAGFSPATATVKSGSKITFTNNSAQNIQVDSNPHPQHTSNSELNVGIISPGQSATVTLTRTGTWTIHNHLEPSVEAMITVQ